jgi:hypothetical protein
VVALTGSLAQRSPSIDGVNRAIGVELRNGLFENSDEIVLRLKAIYKSHCTSRSCVLE